MPQQLFDPQGNPVTLPDDQAQQALLSGKVGLPEGQGVRVKGPDGTVGTVPVADFAQLVASGGRLATDDEYHQAEVQNKYGDTGHAVEAAGIAALDTATLGASNWIAREAGGADTAKTMREIQEANPSATKLGGGLGIAVPLAVDLATGGLAAPEEAALAGSTGLAGDLGRVLKGTVTAPQDLVSGVGSAVSKGLGKLVGTEAESLAGKFTQSAIAKAGGNAAEAGLYSASQYLGEQALEDHPDLSGEKFLASMKMGTLLGAGLGVGGAALGTLGRDLIGRVAPRLDNLADDWLAKGLSSNADRFTKEAAEIPGGIKGIRDELVNRNLVREGDNIRQVADRVIPAAARADADLSATYRSLDEDGVFTMASDVRPTRQQVMRAVDEALPDAKFPSIEEGGRGIDRRAFKQELEGIIGKPEQATTQVERTPAEIRDYIKANPDVLRDMMDGRMPERVRYKSVAKPIVETTVPFSKVVDVQDMIREKIAQNPSPKLLQGLRSLNHSLGDLLENSAAAAVRKTTGKAEEWLQGFEGLIPEEKREFGYTITDNQINKLITDKLADLGHKIAASKRLGFVTQHVAEKLQRGVTKAAEKGPLGAVGASVLGGLGAVALAHPAAALSLGGLYAAGKMVAPIAKKILQERGPLTAAVTLDKVAAMKAVQKANAALDRDIRRGVRAVVHDEPLRSFKSNSIKEKLGYDERVNRVIAAGQDPDVHAAMIERVARPISKHLPNVAKSFQQTALRSTVYLLQQIPPSPSSSSLQPHLDRRTPPKMAQDKFNSIYDVVSNPVSILTKVANGTVTTAEVQAVQNTHPALYAHMLDKINSEIGHLTKPIPYDKVVSLKTMLQSPQLSPAAFQIISSAGAPPPAPSGGKGSKLSRPIKGNLGENVSLGNRMKY